MKRLINKIKTFLKSFSKKTLLITLGFTIGLSVSVFAATWQGTAWIATNQPVDAQKMKENFDFLKEKISVMEGNQNSGSVTCNWNGTTEPSFTGCSGGQYYVCNNGILTRIYKVASSGCS